MRTVATHTVAYVGDSFTEQVGGKKVHFKDWKLTVGGRTIKLAHEKTVIAVTNDGKHVKITANGKEVYED